MTCAGALEAIRSGRDDAAAEAHLEGCAACQRALEAELPPPRRSAAAEDVSALYGRVERDLAAERGPVAWLRTRGRAVRLLPFALGAAGWAAALLAGAPRPDLGALPPVPLALVLTALGAAALHACAITLRPLDRPARPIHPATVAAALALPPLLALALGGADSGPLVAPAGRCLGFGALMGATLVACAWAGDRAAHRTFASGALAAAAAGLCANLALALHCPNGGAGHLLAGHASIGVVLAVAYAALRRRPVSPPS